MPTRVVSMCGVRWKAFVSPFIVPEGLLNRLVREIGLGLTERAKDGHHELGLIARPYFFFP